LLSTELLESLIIFENLITHSPEGITMNDKLTTPEHHLSDKVFFAIRILMAILFLVGGYNKLTGLEAATAYMTKLGIPMPEITVYLAFIFEFGSALLFILGWQLKLVSYAMATFTLVATLYAHQFWNAEPAQFYGQMVHFFKNMTIIGGFFLAAALAPRSQIQEVKE